MTRKKANPGKKDLMDIIESYYLAHILIDLDKRGFFKGLPKSVPVEDYLDNTDIVKMLVTKTDILVPSGKKYFVLNSKYASYINSSFHIEKFLGGYGEVVSAKNGPRIKVNPGKFAEAYEQATPFENHKLILNLLTALGARQILDMGCGMAGLLRSFCKLKKAHTATGIEQNPFMCQQARKEVRLKKMDKQVKIIQGDVTAFNKYIQPGVLEGTDVIIASSILNEFFYTPARLVSFLQKIRRYLPGRFMIVIDYYGILHSRAAMEKRLQHNYIHDMMQVLTGQGVPPKNQAEWNRYYTQAGCKLVHSYNSSGGGINWFIHVVYLGNKPEGIQFK